MKIALNQPYLFPYIGYFQLITAVDRFVIADNVQYIKSGWINGNRTLCFDRERITSLPVKRDDMHLNINQRYFAEPFEQNKQDILNKIGNDYRKAPHFKTGLALLERVMSCGDRNVSVFVTNQLRIVADFLGIRTPFVLSSDVLAKEALKGKDWVVEINRKIGSGRYINALGGQDLYCKEFFRQNGIKLSFLKPQDIKYKQFGQEFISDLSIIDVMMFNSREDIGEMLRKYEFV